MLAAGLELVFDFFPEEAKDIRRAARSAVEQAFPEEAAKVAASFGLSRYGGESTDAAGRAVVLIHGLDDPGKVWSNLGPALFNAKADVWLMHYPNDQPIVDSARLFFEELKRLKAGGIGQVAIVGHSMGGLVSREMLTSPEIGYAETVQAGDAPDVVALIMVGTPNHGSELARFRVFGEFRDQWINLLEGRGHLLRGILDGAGEAKIDLLPGSRFLQTLNDRRHPESVQMMIIAGTLSPWDDGDIERLLVPADENVSGAEQQMAVELEAFFRSMKDGVGDGLVTVESTRLEGVEHRTVRGNHLTIIRNIVEDSDRVPPAVPMIVEYLGELEAGPVGEAAGVN